jgi:hypothetical protein
MCPLCVPHHLGSHRVRHNNSSKLIVKAIQPTAQIAPAQHRRYRQGWYSRQSWGGSATRLTSKKPDVRETQDPVQDRFPDSRRLLENVLTYDPQARKFKIKSRGRSGSPWVPENKFPDVVVRAYQLEREAHDR